MEESMANPADYILVGGDYYKLSRYVDDTGKTSIRRLPWQKWRLNLDFKNNPADKDQILRYDAFCNEPMHINYQRSLGNYYNCYEDIEIVPKAGSWETTRKFLEHLFGDMVEVIYDLLTILYKYPKQMLPILLLIDERQDVQRT